jgi:hypothetical protein
VLIRMTLGSEYGDYENDAFNSECCGNGVLQTIYCENPRGRVCTRTHILLWDFLLAHDNEGPGHLIGSVTLPNMASSTQSASRSQTNGVLAVTTSQTQGNSRQTAIKPHAPRTKVIVRRLAPRLTETEFKTLLGEDWKLGGGKVDWLLYKPGKESKEYGTIRSIKLLY